MNKEFIGVYSRKDAVGAKTYYFVWVAGDLYSVQKLNTFFQAIDILKTIDAATFHAMFTPEPSIKKFPTIEAQKVAEKVVEKEPLFVASPEDVEASLRELFRKAMVRIKRSGSVATATPILDNLLEVEEGITTHHRHMFSDFGTEMRKKKSYKYAVGFTQRALILSSNDDHAHFNMARVLIEMGDFDGAEQHVLTAQFINPDSRIYKKTLRYIALLRMQKQHMDTAPSSILDELPLK